MGPLVLCCGMIIAAWVAYGIFSIRDAYLNRQAEKFAKVYNQASHAQWARFRKAHPEIKCAPRIACSAFVARRLSKERLAELYDDETYTARELKAHAARSATCV